MQTPNIPVVARRCAEEIIGIDINPGEFCYFVGRERAVPRAENPALSGVSEALFAFMARNAAHPGDFYRISTDQVAEIGIQIDI